MQSKTAAIWFVFSCFVIIGIRHGKWKNNDKGDGGAEEEEEEKVTNIIVTGTRDMHSNVKLI